MENSSWASPHALKNDLSREKTLSWLSLGHLLSSSTVGHLPRNRKSKTRTQTFKSLALQTAMKRRRDKPGPLLRKQSKEGSGSGRSAELASSERHWIAKDRDRTQANFVRVLKIQRGKQTIHRRKGMVELRGFGSCPSRPSDA
jgi:hypothetical protein